jgi:Arc/MetJ family transcription regulator
MLNSMPRVKTTVSIDQSNLQAACELLGTTSTSEVVDIALERYVRAERLLRDIRGYLAQPPTPEELLFAEVAAEFDLGDDHVDYEALYGA